jgi:periplasmic protein TonB
VAVTREQLRLWLATPLALVLAGTLSIHVIFVLVVDVLRVTFPYRPEPPAPRVTWLVIPKKPVAVPRPPAAKPQLPQEPTEVKARVDKPVANRSRTQQVRSQPQPPPQEQPPSTDSGGAETIKMDDIAPVASGVPVEQGKNRGPTGKGGSGTGAGTGVGDGAENAPPPPVSIAMIKTPAKPTGDYDYIREYTPAAQQAGIEGDILVRLLVDAAGKVRTATILKGLGYGLDALVLAKAKQLMFIPAIATDDKPVSSVVVFTFKMRLPK